MDVRWKCPGCGAENVGPPDDDTAACAACNDTFFWESLTLVPMSPWDPAEATP